MRTKKRGNVVSSMKIHSVWPWRLPPSKIYPYPSLPPRRPRWKWVPSKRWWPMFPPPKRGFMEFWQENWWCGIKLHWPFPVLPHRKLVWPFLEPTVPPPSFPIIVWMWPLPHPMGTPLILSLVTMLVMAIPPTTWVWVGMFGRYIWHPLWRVLGPGRRNLWKVRTWHRMVVVIPPDSLMVQRVHSRCKHRMWPIPMICVPKADCCPYPALTYFNLPMVKPSSRSVLILHKIFSRIWTLMVHPITEITRNHMNHTWRITIWVIQHSLVEKVPVWLGRSITWPKRVWTYYPSRH